MRIVLLLIAPFLFSSVWAKPSDLNLDFNTYLTQFGVSPLKEQAYCYGQPKFAKGYQVDKLQRIASVSKLFTTLLAIETLDINKRYTTKLYISGDSLHIKGSRDPYFEREKLLLMMQALNDHGYNEFKKVTFNSDFVFYDEELDDHVNILPKHTLIRLTEYFRKNNSGFIQGNWNIVKRFANEENVSLKDQAPSLAVETVEISDLNPLEDLSPTVLTHMSRPLYSILKSMNVMSKNLVSQNLYDEGIKVKQLTTLLAEKGIAPKTFSFFTGSGLPIKEGTSRKDNVSSCRTVLSIVSLIESRLKQLNFVLSDIMAVNGGEDLGTFRNRFRDYPETHEAVISKTGTIKNASALAGKLLMGKPVPFAILNHTIYSSKAREFQDQFVSRMFYHLGQPTPLVYEKISTFPWNESEFFTLAN